MLEHGGRGGLAWGSTQRVQVLGSKGVLVPLGAVRSFGGLWPWLGAAVVLDRASFFCLEKKKKK